MSTDAHWSHNIPEITASVVSSYKRNYALAEDAPVTAEMVLEHTTMEARLTRTLLSSSRENRAEVWEDCYRQLHETLSWRAQYAAVAAKDLNAEFGHFLRLIPVGSRVLEIGSGTGALARYLTSNGRPCVATEITTARGDRASDGLTWHTTDGVHLGDFEPEAHYDCVVSTQVVEHLQPDDIEEHLRGALNVLRPGGRYILTTPHAYFGPADLSRVLLLKTPQFMHLEEYTNRELGAAAAGVGFRIISAAWIPPRRVRHGRSVVIRSPLVYRHLSGMERLIGKRRVPPLLLRLLLFRGDVFLVLTA